MPVTSRVNISAIIVCMIVIFVCLFLPTGNGFCQDKGTGKVHGKLPDKHWLTLESAHFLVHFPEDTEKLAERVAEIAEDVHGKLTPDIKWKPAKKTHIVILDWSDRMNAYASPLPRNVIRIYPVGPGLSELELMFTDDWLRMLVTHEYVHTLTLDMAAGLPGFFRKIFGRSMATVPAAYLPNWIHEGYAVYNENKYTSGGRIRGPYFDMIL